MTTGGMVLCIWGTFAFPIGFTPEIFISQIFAYRLCFASVFTIPPEPQSSLVGLVSYVVCFP